MSDLKSLEDALSGVSLLYWNGLADSERNDLLIVCQRDGEEAALVEIEQQAVGHTPYLAAAEDIEVEVLEAKDICAATVEGEGNGEIRSVNGGKRRGRKAGETMPLLQIGDVVRRFSKKELGAFYLQAAIKGDDDNAAGMASLLLMHGRPLPVVPEPLDISDWTKIDYLGAIAKLMQG